VIPKPLPNMQFNESSPISHNHSPVPTIHESNDSIIQNLNPSKSFPAMSHPHSMPHSPDSTPITIPPRRSTRAKCKPSYLQNYHCNLATQASFPNVIPKADFESGKHYSLSYFLDYNMMSPSYKHFSL
jgi:hypothetical protein